MAVEKELCLNLNKLHTTELGRLRMAKNLGLPAGQVVEWCKDTIRGPGAESRRKGKNWYIETEGCVITVNAHSYTLITAHKRKK